jgi:hypothetical protein
MSDLVRQPSGFEGRVRVASPVWRSWCALEDGLHLVDLGERLLHRVGGVDLHRVPLHEAALQGEVPDGVNVVRLDDGEDDVVRAEDAARSGTRGGRQRAGLRRCCRPRPSAARARPRSASPLPSPKAFRVWPVSAPLCCRPEAPLNRRYRRIPLRPAIEVGKDLPHPLGGRVHREGRSIDGHEGKSISRPTRCLCVELRGTPGSIALPCKAERPLDSF